MSATQRQDEETATTVVGRGPGLLLAHGAGGGIEVNFGPVIARFAERHRTIGVDYPGSGKAPRSADPLTVDRLVDRLIRAADEDGLEQFAVAGYSLGGPVAIRLAARFPERVTALVLTATFARPDAKLALAAEIWSELYATGDHHLLAAFLSFVAFSNAPLDAAGPDGVRSAIDELAGAIAPGTPEHTALVRQVDVRSDARRITAPTLILATVNDPLVSLAIQRDLHDLIAGSRLVELESGHLPFVELPDRWAEATLTFLNEPHRRADVVQELGEGVR
jgi:pimeloyl-ACP methyl ester carboxylesterase